MTLKAPARDPIGDDRALSHLARVTLQVLSRVHCRHEPGRGTVRRAGRSLIANRLRRCERTVSRATAELERTGRIRKVRPRRMPTADGWITCEVQGYVIIDPRKTAGQPDVTSVSPHLLRRSGVAPATTPRAPKNRGRPPDQPPAWRVPVESVAPTGAYLAARTAVRSHSRP